MTTVFLFFNGMSPSEKPQFASYKTKLRIALETALKESGITGGIEIKMAQAVNTQRNVLIKIHTEDAHLQAIKHAESAIVGKVALFTGNLLGETIADDRVRVEYSTEPSPQSNFTERVGDTADNPTAVLDSRGNPSEQEDRAKRFCASAPKYTMDQLIVPTSVREQLQHFIQLERVRGIVFERWGLRRIEPSPSVAMNFYGPSGTGKSMAAHALAQYLGRPILESSYGDIESKYHGDGPKNVQAIFLAAERQNAVLFIDEADSLLSRRLTNVQQGSEQAINSMRSELLLAIQRHTGIVIFATNLVGNYDTAFDTRMQHIKFELPDRECRSRIWRVHLQPETPLADDVDIDELAERFDGFCGRDIKEAVIYGCVRAALAEAAVVSQADLVAAADLRVRQREELYGARTTARGNLEADGTGLKSILETAIRKRENGSNSGSQTTPVVD